MIPRLVPQPAETFFQPLKTSGEPPAIPTTYIRCTRVPAPNFDAAMEQVRKLPKGRVDSIDTGHSPMVTEPAETVRLLLKYAV